MALAISHLTEHTGAEVNGIDLTAPLDAEARARLNRAFIDRSVWLFVAKHCRRINCGRRFACLAMSFRNTTAGLP